MSNWLSRNFGYEDSPVPVPAADADERETAYLFNDIGPLFYVYGRKLDRHGVELIEEGE